MEAWSSGVLTSVLGVDEPSMAKMAIDLIVFSSTPDTHTQGEFVLVTPHGRRLEVYPHGVECEVS